MSALADLLLMLEDDLSPVLLPAVHIDARDRDPKPELARQSAFRSQAKRKCPAVKLVAVPNAAQRGQGARNRARSEGAAWGFPDIMALAPGRIAFLEFKAGTTNPEAHQIEWLNRLVTMGFPCGVFRQPDSALAFLRRHGFPFA